MGKDDRGDDDVPVPDEPLQNEDDESDYSDDDDDNNGAFDPTHPLLRRVQEALRNQLTTSDERLTLQLNEKEAEVDAIKGQREKIGVSLYTFQQGLAKLQMQLEKTHDRYNVFFQQRETAESKLKDFSAKYKTRIEEKEILEKKRNKSQQELDKLKITVKQIDEFNEKCKSEILVTRGAAYATEQAMQKLEAEKQRQDELIDSLNEQLRAAGDQLKVYNGQLASQQEETRQAKETLAEASKEMDAIAVEKREYLQKWKTSLIGMANRDAALQAAETALLAEKEKLRNLELSIKGYKKSIKDEQVENERLTAQLTRTESEIKFLDNQLMIIGDQRKELNEKYTILRSTLERTDKDLHNSQADQREIKADIEHVHKNYEKLVQEKQAFDDKIMENLSDQTTIEKGAQNVWKTTQKLKTEIHEKEIKMGDVQNEVARIKVDSLNTGAHNKELEQTLSAYDKELQEKDKLIEKYELEIRQRHDKIEKKQIYIARLNRKYESLVSKQQDENTGPLEATIKNLSKEIANLQKDIAGLQRDWIKSQTELVSIVSETNTQQEKVQELQSKQTILSQRKLRLNHTYEQHLQEISELQKMVKGMHNDMAKLNDLISKNTGLQTELGNKNFNMETEFMQKLKEMELQSVQTDADIQRLIEEKESVFNEIIEVEKQLMLWEKKIQLEKETQEALDPEYGQPEIKGMKKEIHRMRLRLSQLQRQQEKMIQEMERTIEKKEHIRLGTVAMSGKKQKHYTQATLKKKIMTLKQQLKSNINENKRVVEDVSRQTEINRKLLEELEGQQRIYGEIEDKKYQLTEGINDCYFRKQMNLEHVLMYRKRGQRYQECLEGKMKIKATEERLETELLKSDEKFQKIKDIIGGLREEHPKFDRFLTRLLSFA